MGKVSKKGPLISVIVPIYNVEKYLDKCVDSIVKQSYENLEIILVDDGSPDKCPKKCKEWIKKDRRIKVIHKKNGGLSDARNAGLDKAKGEYITFIDSDDYVEPNYVEFLYRNIVKEKADISMGKQYVRYPKKTYNTGTGNRYVLNAHDCLDKLLYSEDFDVSAWGKLYKRELFNDARFIKGRLFEDTALCYKLIDKSKKIVLDSQPIYYYIMRNNSITNKKFNDSKMDMIISTEEMTDYISKRYPDLKNGCDRRMMFAHLSTLSQLARSKDKNKKYEKELMNYIKKNRKKILKDKRIPKRDRIGLLASYGGFRIFKLCWSFYSLIR